VWYLSQQSGAVSISQMIVPSVMIASDMNSVMNAISALVRFNLLSLAVKCISGLFEVILIPPVVSRFYGVCHLGL
jgi:hypothetical protein